MTHANSSARKIIPKSHLRPFPKGRRPPAHEETAFFVWSLKTVLWQDGVLGGVETDYTPIMFTPQST